MVCVCIIMSAALISQVTQNPLLSSETFPMDHNILTIIIINKWQKFHKNLVTSVGMGAAKSNETR